MRLHHLLLSLGEKETSLGSFPSDFPLTSSWPGHLLIPEPVKGRMGFPPRSDRCYCGGDGERCVWERWDGYLLERRKRGGCGAGQPHPHYTPSQAIMDLMERQNLCHVVRKQDVWVPSLLPSKKEVKPRCFPKLSVLPHTQRKKASRLWTRRLRGQMKGLLLEAEGVSMEPCRSTLVSVLQS